MKYIVECINKQLMVVLDKIVSLKRTNKLKDNLHECTKIQ